MRHRVGPRPGAGAAGGDRVERPPVPQPPVDLLLVSLGGTTGLREADEELADSLREFMEADKPEPDLLAAMRALDFRGHPPETAREWRQIYRVMKALTESRGGE